MTQFDLVRDREVARRLDIGLSTVWAWSKEGRLPKPIKIGNKLTRWKWAEIEEMLSAQGAAK